MTWVISYDVSQNLHRSRVSKALAKQGIRIQKSVFLVECGSQEVNTIVKSLGKLIDPETDSICAWPLAENWRNRQVAYPAEAALTQEIFVIG